MKHPRPVNLNLFTIHFPLPAIISILHRISGVILFLLIPVMLWGLGKSLSSAQSFDEIHACLTHPVCKLFLLAIFSALIYHMIAGIRHLFMDMGVGENVKSGRFSSKLTLIISIILILLAGIWLW